MKMRSEESLVKKKLVCAFTAGNTAHPEPHSFAPAAALFAPRQRAPAVSLYLSPTSYTWRVMFTLGPGEAHSVLG